MFRDERRTRSSVRGLPSVVIALLLLPGAVLASPVTVPGDLPLAATPAPGPAGEFRQWLDNWLSRAPAEAYPKEGQAFAPGETPGLQFNIDPRDDTIFLGYRVPF